MDLKNKVALVTGAARRVGRAIALNLAQAGADIALHYHTSRNAAEELAALIRGAGSRCLLVAADLADPDAADRIVSQVLAGLGRLDILVNNAALFEGRPLADSDAAFWQRTLGVNLLAPALLARAAAPHMRSAGGGRIVNFADILAERPPRQYAAYATSKAAIIGLTRALARELAPAITVNAVAPGIAEFPEDYDTSTREELIARVPLRRAGTPDEVAALVRFLVAQGDYITGEVIRIDGGRSIRP